MSVKAKGWKIALGDYHFEVAEADTKFVHESLARAWYRLFSQDDLDCANTLTFIFQKAKDGITTVLNVADPADRNVVDGIIMGVFSTAEIRYEAITKVTA